MIAIEFPQVNLKLAEDQPEYETLPVFVETRNVVVPKGPNDPQLAIVTKEVPWEMTACFLLSKEEIEQTVRTGKLWYTQCLFGEKFQPVRMSVLNPFEPEPPKKNAFEKLEDFENQSIQTIAFNMVKWFMFDKVTVETETRHNVESTVWITVKIEWTDEEHGRTMHISGQRNDIVHRRLVEWLRQHLTRVIGR